MTEEEIEAAALASVANMGIPDCYFCGFCGEKCLTGEQMISHLEINHAGETLDVTEA